MTLSDDHTAHGVMHEIDATAVVLNAECSRFFVEKGCDRPVEPQSDLCLSDYDYILKVSNPKWYDTSRSLRGVSFVNDNSQ